MALDPWMGPSSTRTSLIFSVQLVAYTIFAVFWNSVELPGYFHVAEDSWVPRDGIYKIVFSFQDSPVSESHLAYCLNPETWQPRWQSCARHQFIAVLAAKRSCLLVNKLLVCQQCFLFLSAYLYFWQHFFVL